MAIVNTNQRAGNRDFNAAKRNKNDEFYTQIADIEKELKRYKQHFKGKVVYCNCDDPYESNFFRYFVLNFKVLGLKQLITTSYKPSPIANTQVELLGGGNSAKHKGRPKVTANRFIINEAEDVDGDGQSDLGDMAMQLRQNKHNEWKALEEDGNFRSDECVALLKQSDIVVTNPPFSLFREYVAQLMKYEKKFLIIGNIGAVSYKQIFPLFMQNKIWLGHSIKSGDREFRVPDSYPLNAAGQRIDEKGVKYIRVKGVRWFTNLPHSGRNEEIILTGIYTPEEYPKYDNYDAIEVGKVKLIPKNYRGKMGVPVTFLDKYNPDQFEIIGLSRGLEKTDDTSINQQFFLNKKELYARICIRLRKGGNTR